MAVFSRLCDKLCDSFDVQKSETIQGLNERYLNRFVTAYVTKGAQKTKLPVLSSNRITKNPAKNFSKHKKPSRDLMMRDDEETKQ